MSTENDYGLPKRSKKRKRTNSEASEPNRSSILRMSDQKTLQLLNLYEEEPCLWNTTLKSYKNPIMKIAATERIANKMNLPYFDRTHVTIKFKNLRNSYCQELKKISASVIQGHQLYRPKVFWFPKMHSFLRPHLKPSKNYDCDNEQDQLFQEEFIIKKEDEESWIEYKNPEHVLIPETTSETCEDNSANDEDTNDNSIYEVDAPEDIQSARSSKKNKFEEDDAVATLREISGQIQSLRRNEDYCEDFGKYVASLLRSLPKSKSLQLQSKIINMIVSDCVSEDNEITQSDEDR